MSVIRIQGVSSTSVLRAGEIAEVEHTERIDRLIAAGYVKQLDAQDSGRPTIVRAPAEVIDNIVRTDGTTVRDEVVPVPVDVEVPVRNAKTEVWLKFVRDLGIEEPDDAKRDKLQADYDEYLDALNG